MALVFADLVQENTSTTGTGTLTLTGAVSTQFQTFAAIGNANTTYYRIISGTNSEVGIGTYTLSGTTLSRDTVLQSIISGAAGTTKITVAAGATVICTYPAEKIVIQDDYGKLTPNNLINCTADGTNAVGFLHVPQNLKAITYTCVLADAGKHMFNTASSVNWVIPANATVAYPIGTVLTFVNGSAASSTITVTTDTLQVVNSASAGTRTLATNGMATAIKVTATKWYISGQGLT